MRTASRNPFLVNLLNRAFAPVDVASIALFRIVFGLLMAGHIWRYYAHGFVTQLWITPKFLFKYYGFGWVQPWPEHWLYLHWLAIGVLALLIAVGLLYRFSIILFFVSYTYFFLLDRGLYVNHIYLVCLVSFLLIFIPAHRAWSVDAWLFPKLENNSVPALSLWVLRAQMGAVYFCAGVAKLCSPDWLHGEPMRTWMMNWPEFGIFGRFAREKWAGYVASYAAMSLDLFVFPLLLWRRTRIIAFCCATAFHLINAYAFDIDFFPWLAISLTTLFFSPSWPRRVIGLLTSKRRQLDSSRAIPNSLTWHRATILSLTAIYVLIQFTVPLRQLLYKGGVEWYCMSPLFTWQMMLRRYALYAHFYVSDPNTGGTATINPADILDEERIIRMGWNPDMLLQFARYLAGHAISPGPKPVEVQTRFYVSVNGRKPRLFIDPTVDLAAEPRAFGRPPWLLEIHEPLPPFGKDYPPNPFAGETN